MSNNGHLQKPMMSLLTGNGTSAQHLQWQQGPDILSTASPRSFLTVHHLSQADQSSSTLPNSWPSGDTT